MKNSEHLLSIRRNHLDEVLHSGIICATDKNYKFTYKKGSTLEKTFLRSCAKPIQAIPLINSSSLITNKELAIICGSHTGSNKHLELIDHLSKKLDINLKNLHCGIHSPLDTKERTSLLKENLSPDVRHNNCSGKHLGMLHACNLNGWTIKNYTHPNHPLQQKILKDITTLSQYKNIKMGIDGCSVPTFYLPIENICRLFYNFKNQSKYTKIFNAMTANPFYVGGKNRIDTEIMRVAKGKILSKVGAQGLIICLKDDGSTLVVKIADGSELARSIVTVHMLIKLKWLKKTDLENSNLIHLFNYKVTNLKKKIVGDIKLLLN